MTGKRFNRVGGYVYEGDKCISHFEDVSHRDDIVELLNEQHEENQHKQKLLHLAANKIDRLLEENEQLKKELKVYRKLASCSNCRYHDYDWDINDGYGGEEYEVCDKGNEVTDGICEGWEEF